MLPFNQIIDTSITYLDTMTRKKYYTSNFKQNV